MEKDDLTLPKKNTYTKLYSEKSTGTRFVGACDIIIIKKTAGPRERLY